MRYSKTVPRRKTGHAAFLMSALALSSPTVSLSSFHFLSAVVAELPLLWNILWMPSFLCCGIFCERRTPQAWIIGPRNGNVGIGQVCHVSADSSGVRACSLGLPRPSYHSCLVNHIHFFPQWNRTQKTSELFLQTISYGFLPIQRGTVRFGRGSLCEQKF